PAQGLTNDHSLERRLCQKASQRPRVFAAGGVCRTGSAVFLPPRHRRSVPASVGLDRAPDSGHGPAAASGSRTRRYVRARPDQCHHGKSRDAGEGVAVVAGYTNATFEGAVTLVNVWASWCVPCHDEVPFLEQLSKDKRIQLVGINYKDAPDNARRFLNRYGNPFVATGRDEAGRASIDWGVY